MNVMRKLRGTTGGNASSTQTSIANNAENLASTTGTNEDVSLDDRLQTSLHTLKKLFSEYTHPRDPLTEQERDMKLYQMLPIFCRVCLPIITWY